MKDHIVLHGEIYSLVKIQRGELTAIYHANNKYLRTGDTARINQNLQLHQYMEFSGFPVPKILERGELNGMNYFIESSLGNKQFWELFSEDILHSKVISDKNFNDFINLTLLLAKAQLHTKTANMNPDIFAEKINLNTVCDELPQYANKIRRLFREVTKRLSIFPWTLNQGDFSAHNSFPSGIIDFTDALYAPFGYDLLGAIVHIDYFPMSQDYEYFAQYQFTDKQKHDYLVAMDSFAHEHGLPNFSEFIKEFEFCKAVWLLVGLHKWPKLQQYRYDLFIERFLKDSVGN